MSNDYLGNGHHHDWLIDDNENNDGVDPVGRERGAALEEHCHSLLLLQNKVFLLCRRFLVDCCSLKLKLCECEGSFLFCLGDIVGTDLTVWTRQCHNCFLTSRLNLMNTKE